MLFPAFASHCWLPGLGSLGARCCNLVSFVHENEFVLLFALICLINYVYASDYYVFFFAVFLLGFPQQLGGFPTQHFPGVIRALAVRAIK